MNESESKPDEAPGKDGGDGGTETDDPGQKKEKVLHTRISEQLDRMQAQT